jgi:hypothetical protein
MFIMPANILFAETTPAGLAIFGIIGAGLVGWGIWALVRSVGRRNKTGA